MQEKKPIKHYRKPRLESFGNVSELTQSGQFQYFFEDEAYYTSPV